MKKTLLLIFLFLVITAPFSKIRAQEEKKYTTYITKKGESLRSIAKKIGCRTREIKNLNPDAEKFPPANTTLIVPKTEKYKGWFSEQLDHKQSEKDKPERLIHKVRKGETFYSLAKKYNVTIQSIKDLNPQTKEGLKEGQDLIIPDRSDFTSEHKNTYDKMTMYKVKKGDTEWSIAQAHGIKVEELEKANPTLKKEGLKEGQNIWVPVMPAHEETEMEIIEGAVIYHKVKPDDTLFKIAVMYGVTMEEIEKLNPEATKMLRPYMLLKIPAKKKGKFFTHTVKKGETLYAISRFFENSEEELLENNPALKDGLKTGMELLILPVFTPDGTNHTNLSATGESSQFFPRDSTRFVYPVRLSFLLPLMLDKGENLSSKEKKIQDIAVSFYMGAEMALDSLRKAGIFVNAHVFDTGNSYQNLTRIALNDDFKQSQIAIGPFFFDKAVALAKVRSRIPVVTPFYSNKQQYDNHKKVIKSAPDNALLLKCLTNYLKKNKSGTDKYIVITDNREKNNLIARQIGSILKTTDSVVSLQYIYPSHNKKDESLIYMDKKELEKSIVENKTHHVILIADENIVISDVINTYGVLSLHNKVTLYTLKNFKDVNHIDYEQLAHLNWTFVNRGFQETDTPQLKNFRQKFVEKNHALPDDKALKGFDLTLDIIQRLAAYGDNWEDGLAAGKSQRLANNFYFKPTGDGDYRNTAVRLIEFTKDMEFKEIEP